MPSTAEDHEQPRNRARYHGAHDTLRENDTGSSRYTSIARPIIEMSFSKSGGIFQFLLDCGGARRNLFLEYQDDDALCPSNMALQKMCDGLKSDDEHLIQEARRACLSSTWPFLEKDYEARLENGITGSILPDGCCKRSTVRLQVKSAQGKCLQQGAKIQ